MIDREKTSARPIRAIESPSTASGLTAGLLGYLKTRDITFHKLGNEEINAIEEAAARLENAAAGTAIFGASHFRYFHEPAEVTEVTDQAAANAEYWTERMGSRFYEAHPLYSDRRHTIYRAPIDEDFYLSCKGGSGSGTFSLDLAVGMEKGQVVRPTWELWKVGLDSKKEPDSSRTIRLIRTGSAMTTKQPEWQEKTEAYQKFYKRFGLKLNRGLTFLSLFLAHELSEVKQIQAISLQGVRNGLITHLKNRRTINFDYTDHFQRCGFSATEDPHWLTTPNSPAGFYDALRTSPSDGNGLRKYEIDGLNVLIDSFRQLKCVRTSQPIPLSVASSTSSAELSAAIPAHRAIYNR